MRWSFWPFVLAEFCRRCETKGTWRGVCSGVHLQSRWGGKGKPHEAVGFLALGWNWFHCLSESVTRCATRISVFAGTTLRGRFPNIFSSVLSKSRKWPRRTVGGSNPPKTPVASPLHGWPCDYHMCVLCMHTARVTDSVTIRVSVRKL